MGRACTVCAHPEVGAIDRSLVEGAPNRRVASRHGVTERAVRTALLRALSPGAWTATASLWSAYEKWGRETGAKEFLGTKKLYERLRARGCRPATWRQDGREGVRGWTGIGLLPDVDASTGVDGRIGNSPCAGNA